MGSTTVYCQWMDDGVVSMPDTLLYFGMNNNTVSDPRTDSGSAALLAELVDLHHDYLFCYARRYFRDEERVEVVVQETYLAAAEGIDSFEFRATARTWLTGILRHKIIDAIRGEERERRTFVASEPEDDTSPLFDSRGHWTAECGPQHWREDPDLVLSQKEFLGVADSCLKKLPERLRQVFLLREREEISSEDLCTQLSITPANLRVLLYRARLNLQSCLQRFWFMKTSTDEGL